MYRSTFAWPRLWSEVTGQLHAALDHGWEEGWALGLVWTICRRENVLPCQDLNSDPLGHLERSPSLYRLVPNNFPDMRADYATFECIGKLSRVAMFTLWGWTLFSSWVTHEFAWRRTQNVTNERILIRLTWVQMLSVLYYHSVKYMETFEWTTFAENKE
jgi:hypothetical protein